MCDKIKLEFNINQLVLIRQVLSEYLTLINNQIDENPQNWKLTYEKITIEYIINYIDVISCESLL